jgi:hypothetical protein
LTAARASFTLANSLASGGNLKQQTSWTKLALWLASAAMLGSAAVAIGLDVHKRFVIHQFKQRQLGCAQTDAMLRKASQGRGLFLRFSGQFRGTWKNFPCGAYYRAVYLLYPLPVLVGEPSQLINPHDGAEQIRQAANFDPDGAWLLRHGVPRELSYCYSDSGNITVTMQAAAPAPAPQ